MTVSSSTHYSIAVQNTAVVQHYVAMHGWLMTTVRRLMPPNPRQHVAIHSQFALPSDSQQLSPLTWTLREACLMFWLLQADASTSQHLP